MQLLTCRQALACLITVTHLLSVTWLGFPLIASAQNVDADPPVIEFEVVPDGIKGDAQVFSATVTDEVGVQSVVFYYRFTAESSYESKPMKVLGDSDLYAVTIDSSDQIENVELIQYYIEAMDSTGNRTLQGFAFDPLERQLSVPAPAPTATTAEPAPVVGISTSRKILYGVLGLVVIGALASAAGGGGGGSSEPGVDVTVVVDPLL